MGAVKVLHLDWHTKEIMPGDTTECVKRRVKVSQYAPFRSGPICTVGEVKLRCNAYEENDGRFAIAILTGRRVQ